MRLLQKFIVRSDHKAISWLTSLKIIDQIVAHWYEGVDFIRQC